MPEQAVRTATRVIIVSHRTLVLRGFARIMFLIPIFRANFVKMSRVRVLEKLSQFPAVGE